MNEIRVENVVYRRFVKRTMAIWGAAAAVISLDGIATGSATTALVGPWFMLTLVVPTAYGLKWVGSIAAQEHLCLTDSGISYGEKFYVPWAQVHGAAKRGVGRGRIVLLAPEWRPPGFIARIERRLGLPLSDYDRKWKENPEVIKLLQEHVPGIGDFL